jgi:hypothetical protein
MKLFMSQSAQSKVNHVLIMLITPCCNRGKRMLAERLQQAAARTVSLINLSFCISIIQVLKSAKNSSLQSIYTRLLEHPAKAAAKILRATQKQLCCHSTC